MHSVIPPTTHPAGPAELEGFFLSRECDDIRAWPRVLLIAAHPDDETIGAGVLLSRRKNVQVLHVTDGSPLNLADALAAGFRTREEYAEARRRETVAALALAGISEDAIANLQFTDQQTAFHLREISDAILKVVQEVRPEIVLTHSYEGGHPDHDSVALACHLAGQRCGDAAFCLCEFSGYHAGNGGMEVYQFLRQEGRERQFTYCLTPAERELKIAMINRFSTQARTLQAFSLPEVEKFRVAPPYDFAKPPHAGKLWYENFNWGVDGPAWRKMATQTLSEIFHPLTV